MSVEDMRAVFIGVIVVSSVVLVGIGVAVVVERSKRARAVREYFRKRGLTE